MKIPVSPSVWAQLTNGIPLMLIIGSILGSYYTVKIELATMNERISSLTESNRGVIEIANEDRKRVNGIEVRVATLEERTRNLRSASASTLSASLSLISSPTYQNEQRASIMYSSQEPPQSSPVPSPEPSPEPVLDIGEDLKKLVQDIRDETGL